MGNQRNSRKRKPTTKISLAAAADDSEPETPLRRTSRTLPLKRPNLTRKPGLTAKAATVASEGSKKAIKNRQSVTWADNDVSIDAGEDDEDEEDLGIYDEYDEDIEEVKRHVAAAAGT
jgi:hypothetical protein